MPYETVKKFERTIAKFCGAKYGVSVSSCTNAIFLSALYRKQKVYAPKTVNMPTKTYIGVACSLINAGYKINFYDDYWKGIYKIYPLNIVDSALRFKRGCYLSDTLYCLSFHAHKHLPIGRGGMILTNDYKAVRWLKQARFDGRQEKAMLDQDRFAVCGWNMYMTPEQAARGLTLFQLIKEELEDAEDLNDYETYPDLSKIRMFKNEKDY